MSNATFNVKRRLPRERPKLIARLCSPVVLAACSLLLVASAGCDRLKGDSPDALVRKAFDPNDADNRRIGITGLAKHDWGRREPYLKGYAKLARVDADPTVRSAAIRALGSGGPEAGAYVADIVAALGDSAEPVRWDAAVALDAVTGEAAVVPLIRCASGDPSTEVRRCSVMALRHYRRSDVLAALIACMDDKSFAVARQARLSLVELAGRDLGPGPDAWCAEGDALLATPVPAKRAWWLLTKTPGPTPATAPATSPTSRP